MWFADIIECPDGSSVLREISTTCNVFDGCDVAAVGVKPHHVVGREFLGTSWHEFNGKPHRVVRWFCVGHDRNGYWLFATDGSGEWRNVSERAIGASFHEVIDERRGDE